MMRLTKVELRRLFSRRLTAFALLGALLITGLALFGAFQEAQPLSGEEQALQKAAFEQAQKDFAVNGKQMVEDCRKQQAEVQQNDPKADFGCNQMEPTLENMGGKPVATFKVMSRNILLGEAYLLASVCFLIGAGFVAAEFSSGSMANWLTFEPRRMRVYASKLAAAGLGLVPVTAALLSLLIAGVWLITRQLGSTAGTTAEVWGDIAEMGGRAVALAVAAAVGGAAVAVLVRHTAAVLGIAIGYLVVVELVLGQWLQGARPWLLQLNIQAWLEHDARYSIPVCATDSRGNYACEQVEKVLSFAQSSVYLGLLMVFGLALAALVFRRRDVS